MVKGGIVGGGPIGSRPLGPSVLDHLRSDLVGSFWTSRSRYVEVNSNLLRSLLVVRLSKSNDDAATTSKSTFPASYDRPLLDPNASIFLRNALRP